MRLCSQAKDARISDDPQTLSPVLVSVDSIRDLQKSGTILEEGFEPNEGRHDLPYPQTSCGTVGCFSPVFSILQSTPEFRQERAAKRRPSMRSD